MSRHARTLDIPEAQVAVYYEDDPHFHWHVRVLLASVGGSRWIGDTPTLSIQTIDLPKFRVQPVARAAEFPAGIRGRAFHVDAIADQDLDRLRADAYALARILGGTVAGATEPSVATWHVSEPSRPSYAERVSLEVSKDPARCVVRGMVALVEIGFGYPDLQAHLAAAFRREAAGVRAQISANKGEEVGRLGKGVFPLHALAAVIQGLGSDPVAIGKQNRVALAVGGDRRRVARHHIRTVEHVGDTSKAVRLTLRAKGP